MRMTADELRESLVTELRGTFQRFFAEVAKTGTMPPGCEWRLAFRTEHPGVDVPPFIREGWPHLCYLDLRAGSVAGLEVDEGGLTWPCAFGATHARVRIPFDAIVLLHDADRARVAIRVLSPDDLDRLEREAQAQAEAAAAEQGPAHGNVARFPGRR